MPTGTRVDRCYQKIKGKYGKSSAVAICQDSTRQSLRTGKSRSKSGRPIGRKIRRGKR